MARPRARSRATPSTSSSTSARSSRRSPAPSVRRTACRSPTRKHSFRGALADYVDDDERAVDGEYDESRRGVVPGLGPAVQQHAQRHRRPHARLPDCAPADGGRPSNPQHVTLEDGTEFELDHGAVTIAAITSCTNTSNPSVMIGAALLAKKAVEKGLHPQAVGQDHAGAGLEGRLRLLREVRPHAVPRQARLQPRRLRLHDLHRQLRPADPRGQRRRQRRRPRGRRRCSRATATSRVASTPTSR